MAKKAKLEGRIRYVEDWHGEGEHYLFESKWTNEEDWGLESAFPLCSFEDGELVLGEGDLVHYTALTKIRDWLKLGVDFYFGK